MGEGYWRRCVVGGVLAVSLGCGERPEHLVRPAVRETTASPETASTVESLPKPTTALIARKASTQKTKVKLIVLGSFPSELRSAVADGLKRAWGVDVETLETIGLPRAAYYPPRKRYRADTLIERLQTSLGANPEHAFVLGLTEVDVSTTKDTHRDWGVIGLAFIGGPSGIVSLHRIVPSARDPEQVRHRLQIVTAHELGHMFGLPHCDEPGCIMRDAEGTLVHVDESHGELGPACKVRLLAP